eukprot:1154062-Pelagomonas_calceolata.AAC.2
MRTRQILKLHSREIFKIHSREISWRGPRVDVSLIHSNSQKNLERTITRSRPVKLCGGRGTDAAGTLVLSQAHSCSHTCVLTGVDAKHQKDREAAQNTPGAHLGVKLDVWHK